MLIGIGLLLVLLNYAPDLVCCDETADAVHRTFRPHKVLPHHFARSKPSEARCALDAVVDVLDHRAGDVGLLAASPLALTLQASPCLVLELGARHVVGSRQLVHDLLIRPVIFRHLRPLRIKAAHHHLIDGRIGVAEEVALEVVALRVDAGHEGLVASLVGQLHVAGHVATADRVWHVHGLGDALLALGAR